MDLVFDRIENIMEKEKNAGYQIFFLSTMISKGISLRIVNIYIISRKSSPLYFEKPSRSNVDSLFVYIHLFILNIYFEFQVYYILGSKKKKCALFNVEYFEN